MPTPCDRCKRLDLKCLVDVRSGRCKTCAEHKKKCNLRVTFKEFERLAKARQALSDQVESAEDELESAEAAVVAAHEKVLKARARARRLRKELRFHERKEDEAYTRELAGIEEVERMESGDVPEVLETPPTELSLDELLASGELLDFPLDEGVDLNALMAPPLSWGQITGYSPSSWAAPEVAAGGPSSSRPADFSPG
ncbi:MAG: hypothetical protein L6R35_007518 [Caloplaca aegaea]|nr:MAG: hypothetical protein L6R35_007518 [Caloplaca aegaea]